MAKPPCSLVNIEAKQFCKKIKVHFSSGLGDQTEANWKGYILEGCQQERFLGFPSGRERCREVRDPSILGSKSEGFSVLKPGDLGLSILTPWDPKWTFLLWIE